MAERVSELRTSALRAAELADGPFEVVPFIKDAGLGDCAALVIATRSLGLGGNACAERADVSAALKALEAVGYPQPVVAIVVIDDPTAPDFDTYELRVALETVDPESILIVDSKAAEVTRSCLGIEALEEGAVVEASGRNVLFVGEFADMLLDLDRKRAAWERIKSLAPGHCIY